MPTEVSFDVTPEEKEFIRQIAVRAHEEIYKPNKIKNVDKLDTQMDLCATIAQGVPLRLEDLLNADAFNFSHDICGIANCLNRETGKLERHFVPRFVKRKK